MVKTELTEKAYEMTLRVLTHKAKEIFAWRIATGNNTRDDEYNLVTEALNMLKMRGRYE